MKAARKFTRERWRYIEGYENLYSISDAGRVYSWGNSKRPMGRMLSCRPNKRGYRYATLYTGIPGRNSGAKIKVSVLVLQTFRGKATDDKTDACHGDGNPSNDQLKNLRWGTRKENVDDSRRHGTLAKGEKSGQAKLTDLQALEIRRRYELGEKGTDLAREYGVSPSTVSMIFRGQRRST